MTVVQPQHKQRITLWFCLSIAFICLLAAIIFISHLDSESMWIDESMTLNTIRAGFPNLVIIVAHDVHPPIYFIWVYLWHLLINNDSLFMLRLSSAIPAVITIALCYRLGIEWFETRLAGFIAAAFLATSGIFVYYSRDLRMYPLTVMLVTLSWLMLTRFLKGRRGAEWGYAAATGLMVYTYYYTGFIAFIQFIFVLVFFRQKIQRFLLAGIVAFLAFVPYIPTFLDQLWIAKAQSGNVTSGPIIGKFLGTIPTTWASIWDFITTYTAKQPAYILLIIVLAVVLGLSARPQQRKWIAAAVIWLFLTTILFFTLNLAIPIYGLRYVLMIIPALALLAGCALSLLPTVNMKIAAVLVVLAVGLVDHPDGFLPPRAPHRELLKTVDERALPTDTVWYNLTDGALGSSFSDDVKYHVQQDAPHLNPDNWVWHAPMEYLDSVKVPRVWDIRPYWIKMPEQAEKPLIKERTVTETYSFGAYTVKLYEAPPLEKQPVHLGDLFEVLTSPTIQPTYHTGQDLLIKTWWHVLKQPTLDYSYSLIVTSADSMNTLVQTDAGLVMNNETLTNLPTSQWGVSNQFVYNKFSFKLPSTLASGKYRLWLAVYFYADPKRLPVTPSPDIKNDTALSLIQVSDFQVNQ